MPHRDLRFDRLMSAMIEAERERDDRHPSGTWIG
jgi:hypothetical protein